MKTQTSTYAVDLINNYSAENNLKCYADGLTDGECLLCIEEYDKEYKLDAAIRELNTFAMPAHMIITKIGFNHCLADDSGHVPIDTSVVKVKIIDFHEEDEPVYLKSEDGDKGDETISIYKFDRFEPTDVCMKAVYKAPYKGRYFRYGVGMTFKMTGIEIGLLREGDTPPLLSNKSEFERTVCSVGNPFSDYVGIERAYYPKKVLQPVTK